MPYEGGSSDFDQTFVNEETTKDSFNLATSFQIRIKDTQTSLKHVVCKSPPHHENKACRAKFYSTKRPQGRALHWLKPLLLRPKDKSVSWILMNHQPLKSHCCPVDCEALDFSYGMLVL